MSAVSVLCRFGVVFIPVEAYKKRMKKKGLLVHIRQLQLKPPHIAAGSR